MIFCIEDDNGIRELIIYTLNSSGFNAIGFANPMLMWKEINKTKPELIILDIMLPNEDGITTLKKIRENNETSDIPVIIASAKGTEYDKIIGLDSGADDYLAKPFGMMEMISRVKAVLRRYSPNESAKQLGAGNIKINIEMHRVSVDGKDIILTLKEYELLKYFMENIGIVFSREQLLSKIWGSDFLGETRTVDVHIGTLRNKLGTCGDQIITVRGVGYKMEAKND